MALIGPDFLMWFIEFLKYYGPLSVFIGVIIEEVVVPIPSPLVIMGAGFVLIPPGISIQEALWQMLYMIVVPAAIAGTIGSFFTYGIGYFGGERVIKRFSKFLGVEWGQIEKYKSRLETGKKTWISVVILRAIPIVPISFVSVTIGFLRLSWKKYAIATFLGSIPRAFFYGFFGWYFGNTYLTLASSLQFYENLVLGVLIALILFAFYIYRRKRRSNSLIKK